MKLFKSFNSLLLISALVLPLLINACGGGGGSTTCDDVAGEWHTVERNYSPNCYGDPHYWLENKLYTVTQDGCAITVTDNEQNSYEGTVSGSSISWTGSFQTEGGTVTQSLDLTVSGNSFMGGANWTWSDGIDTCNGLNELIGTTDYISEDLTGTWTVEITIRYDNCPPDFDPVNSVHTQQISVVQNLDNVTINDGENPSYVGTLIGSILIISETYDDQEGTGLVETLVNFTSNTTGEGYEVDEFTTYIGGASCLEVLDFSLTKNP